MPPSLFYLIQTVFLIYMSLQDHRTLHISMAPLLLFFIFTIVGLGLIDRPVDVYLTVTTIIGLVILKIAFSVALKKSVIGNGDLGLLMPLLLGLSLPELPLFLVLSGVGGLFTLKLRGQSKAPFVPALSFAYLVVVILRYL